MRMLYWIIWLGPNAVTSVFVSKGQKETANRSRGRSRGKERRYYPTVFEEKVMISGMKE